MFSDGSSVLAVCAVCSLINMVTANWNKVCTPFSTRPHPHGICGRRIDETLDLLCVNGYNEYPTYSGFGRRKRDSPVSSAQGKTRNRASDFLIPKRDAHSFLVKRSSYYERGIVCECCYHSCSILELLSYCKDGPGLYGLFKRSIRSQDKERTLNNQPHLPIK